MKNIMKIILASITLILVHNAGFAQTLDLGTASSYALFTEVGAFNNTSTSIITGDIGTNAGAFTGFPPGTVSGNIHVADATSLQVATDITTAYNQLLASTCGAVVIGTTLGTNQTLTANIYCLGAAATINGDLILDGEGNPNAVFIFKIDGALSAGVSSRVKLINSASLCNVYWQVNGAFELGDSSVFRGTLIANGAITLLESASLIGRGFSLAGAINLHNNIVNLVIPPVVADITGITTVCMGNTTSLSNNTIGGFWSSSITSAATINNSGIVTSIGAGTTIISYTVTNAGGCITASTTTVTINANTSSSSSIGICSTDTPYTWNGNSYSNAGTYVVHLANHAGCDSAATLVLGVTAFSTPSISIASNEDTNICPGTSVVFTATPTNGGLAPMYQWKRNGVNTGTNNYIYIDTSLASKDTILCVLTSNANCISTSNAISNSIIIRLQSNGTWRGIISNSWNTVGNWCGGVPTETTNVIIPSAPSNLPVIDTMPGHAIASLTVDNNASLSISQGIMLLVNGNVLNHSNINGAGNLTFSGSTEQSIGGAGNLSNVTINNSVTHVVLNANKTITGILTLTNGILNINGNTLVLGAIPSVGSGNLSANDTGSTIVFTNAASHIRNGLFSSNIVKNLAINRSDGVLMDGDLTISGVYTAISGKLNLGTYMLTLNGTVSGMSSSNSFTGVHTNSTIGSTLNITSANVVGTVYFDQTIDASTSVVTTGTNGFKDIIMSGGGSMILGNKLNLFNKLSVSAGSLTTGGNLVLRSHAGNTAFVAANTTGVSGLVTVERYIHATRRAWRLLTAPLTQSGASCSASIQSNWQSGFGYNAGYGTNIYGPPYLAAGAPNGFDGWTNSNSLLSYNSYSGATGGFVNVTNTINEDMFTSASSAANKAYFLFVRGDKTVSATSSGSTPNAYVETTLAAKGNLQTGTQIFNLTNLNSKFVMMGNPYAAPIDMESVVNNSETIGLDGNINTWDPNLGSPGVNASVGGYCTFNSATWIPSAGNQSKYFQSGQAFFIVPNNTTAAIVFKEANKATSTTNNTNTTGAVNGLMDLFRIKLNFIKSNGMRYLADGTLAAFKASFSKDVTAEDGPKLKNGAENISFKRNGILLAIEGHPFITGHDTLFVNFSGLKADSSYELQIEPTNFDASVTNCTLIDHYLGSETTVSLYGTSLYGFTISSSIISSYASDRFEFRFNSSGTLSNNSIILKASQKEKAIVVSWDVAGENGMRDYRVEKSTNGKDFVEINVQNAKNSNTIESYNYADIHPVNSSNYYRIKATNINDNLYYSQTVKIDIDSKLNAGVVIYPNPSKGNYINFQLTNLEKGIYTNRIINAVGQQVLSFIFIHNGGTTTENHKLTRKLSVGTYTLQIINSDGEIKQQQMIVE